MAEKYVKEYLDSAIIFQITIMVIKIILLLLSPYIIRCLIKKIKQLITPNEFILYNETYCIFSYYLLKASTYLIIPNAFVILIDILTIIDMLIKVDQN